MRMIVTAGVLFTALLLAAISVVHAKPALPNGDAVAPATLIGE